MVTMITMLRRRSTLFLYWSFALSCRLKETSTKALLHPPTYKKKAVVVGGGPVGLATALTLSNPPHCMNVTLVEQSTPSTYEPSKAYLYMVNPRGQVWTARFPRVQALLEERGSNAIGGFGAFVIVPSDPKDPIPEPRKLSISDRKYVTASYWIPRHTMTALLEQVIRDEQAAGNKNNETGTVQLWFGTKFVDMETESDGMLKVTVEHVSDPSARYQECFTAHLVVGADGMNSAVRDFLGDDVTRPLKTNWLTMNPRKFTVRKWTSASSGLRMKVLQFPPAFEIPDSDGTMLQTTSETVYAIRSMNRGPRNYVSLGLLPVKDPTMIRPTNVITRPNHDIWKLQGAAEIKEWFTRAFPRLQLENMINDAEWERFAQAQGTTFPKCQYCPGLQVSSWDGSAGVALVGDAIHAFPPDIGQGINAGLADVEALDRALRGTDMLTNVTSETPPATLGDALKEYERVRSPEVGALIRLARFGSPYQYRQPLYKDRVGRFLWSTNVALRLMLNKVSFGMIPPAAIVMAQDRDLTFRKVMRRADLTTAGLTVSCVALLWSVVRRFFVKLAVSSVY